jgi:hypothetical protein
MILVQNKKASHGGPVSAAFELVSAAGLEPATHALKASLNH